MTLRETLRNPGGCQGGKEHVQLLDTIRFSAHKILLDWGVEHSCIVADKLMALAMGFPKGPSRKGRRYPDAIFIADDEPMPYIIEVGRHQPGTWTCPVIHVGFDRQVSYIQTIHVSGQTAFVGYLLLAIDAALSHFPALWYESGAK